jgi:phosphate transport system permease protein
MRAMNDQTPVSTLSVLTLEQSEQLRKRRRLKDWGARTGIMLGGVGVIGAVALIFFYLLWEVAPLFGAAEVERLHAWEQADGGQDLFLAVEEQNEVGFRVTAAGDLQFFDVADGKPISTRRAAGREEAPVVVAPATAGGELLGLAWADGSALVVEAEYAARYAEDGTRSIAADITYPFGEQPFAVASGALVTHLAVKADDGLQFAALTADNTLAVVAFEAEENMMTGETTIAETDRYSLALAGAVQNLWFDADGRFLFVVFVDGRIDAINLASSNRDITTQHLPEGRSATSSAMLLGRVSLLVGDDTGSITQLFMVRDANNDYALKTVRSLKLGNAPITHIVPEQRRKSFIAIDDTGTAGLISTTASRVALATPVAQGAVDAVAISPRGNGLLVRAGNGVTKFSVHNEHPDVSWSALWGKVWYEGYDEPKYIWQSSAANNDFEPKYSLMPLVFGTLKAAIFAMLLAIPLAVCGAIYTAYFMAPSLRTMVKPTIELMAALPTVILGFLAGLWLAPVVEASLPGVFAMLIVTPVAVIISAWVWYQTPERFRLAMPQGWEPILLIPVIVLGAGIPLALSDWMETVFFAGDIRLWLHDVMDIPFDQRNALIIGFAMGFAVIPTIYSIAEDALFEVPRHLTQGSLALGATPWQTMLRVVLPTASPGIFSAVMMGFGRAVGETMIVLMATGNTPVMTMNIFEGLRTLSANIAVEMPESEVGSSHFRILFLAALVLFLFTFVVNTSAELVRQRLRRKYGSL